MREASATRIRSLRGGAGGSEAEHLLHVVQAGGASAHPDRGAHGAAREVVAREGAVGELEALGYSDLRPGRLVELRIHGVETDDIRRRIEAGDPHPSLSRLQSRMLRPDPFLTCRKPLLWTHPWVSTMIQQLRMCWTADRRIPLFQYSML